MFDTGTLNIVRTYLFTVQRKWWSTMGRRRDTPGNTVAIIPAIRAWEQQLTVRRDATETAPEAAASSERYRIFIVSTRFRQPGSPGMHTDEGDYATSRAERNPRVSPVTTLPRSPLPSLPCPPPPPPPPRPRDHLPLTSAGHFLANLSGHSRYSLLRLC